MTKAVIFLPVLGLLAIAAAEERPAEWRAMNYAPRGHPYFRMLYDWFTVDPATGRLVRQLAEADFIVLRKAGFNAVHLYLWDQPTFEQFYRKGSSKLLEPAGFSFPDPVISPRRQWEALEDFVGLAGEHGLWVIPHFVHTPFNDALDSLPRSGVEKRADEIAGWASAFIRLLTPRHRNLLAWGALYALEPAPADDPDSPNPYSLLWRRVYLKLQRTLAESAAPGENPPPLFTYLHLPSQGRDIAGGAAVAPGPLEGYSLDAAAAKQRYASMRRHLGHELGRPAAPDLVYTYVFGPDTTAIEHSLRALTTGPGALPAGRLFIAEYGISAPFGASDRPLLAFGENGAPTADLGGQALWLRQCLCAFRAAGINKAAYWTMYDAAGLWSSPVWSLPPGEVSLNGHWGLAFESPVRGFKPAWAILRGFHSGRPLPCEAAPLAAVVPAGGDPVYWATRASRPARQVPADQEGEIAVRAVVSPASFQKTSWQPGSLITLLVSGLRGLPPLWQAPGYPLPSSQFGVRIEFAGWGPGSLEGNERLDGALLAMTDEGGYQQINVQAPWEIFYTGSITVKQDGRSSPAQTTDSLEFSEFFRGPGGHALAFDERTGAQITPDNPAKPGEAIWLYLTNLRTRPRVVPPTGQPVDESRPPSDYEVAVSALKSEYRMAADGVEARAPVSWVRLAPESVGLFRMRLIVPQVKVAQPVALYYYYCYNSHGSFFPCLVGWPTGRTTIPVLP